MGDIFNMENRFFRFVMKLTNLILLNLIWIIFSIPIVTMGAATTAVYYVTLKMVKNEEGYIIKSFFKAFKQNLKQATVIEIIFLLVGVILYADIRYFLLHTSIFAYLFVAVFIIILMIYIFTLIFVFPIVSKYNNTVFGTIKNAVIMSLQHLRTSLSMAILLVVIAYGFYASLPIMLICPFIAVSGYAYVGSILFSGIFSKYQR